MDRENNKKLFRFKIRMKLNERENKRKKLIKPPIQPRYDDVFWNGLEWLNSL